MLFVSFMYMPMVERVMAPPGSRYVHELNLCIYEQS